MVQKMRKVLVVDDDPNILKMLSFLLKDMDYEVSVSENGVDALEKVKKDEPDIVLLDIMMPKMDGIQTLREIKKINEKIKVIMITAYEREGKKIVEAFKFGAYDCIFKPIDFRYLKENVLETINFNSNGQKDTDS